MKILWFSWKDKKNPQAGGAELLDSEMAKKLVGEGHHVIFVVAGYESGLEREIIDGYEVIRVGNKWTVYWQAYRYYKKYLQGWADLVIDECNTMPFFCKFYVKEKTVFWIQQFAREIWFYQMFFPLSLIGYLLEPLYLRLFKDQMVFTFAKSTKNDLIKYGFRSENIAILKETFVIEPLQDNEQVEKFTEPTILFLSALRRMKRVVHVIQAFEVAKKNIHGLKLYIAGSGKGLYFKKVLRMMESSPFKEDIVYLGSLGMKDKKKIEILQKSHFICCTSVREGWGIIVSEAGSQRTPAIVYDVNGLKDAVNYGEAGLVCSENSPKGLSCKIIEAFDSSKTNYQMLQENAFNYAKQVNVDGNLDILCKHT